MFICGILILCSLSRISTMAVGFFLPQYSSRIPTSMSLLRSQVSLRKPSYYLRSMDSNLRREILNLVSRHPFPGLWGALFFRWVPYSRFPAPPTICLRAVLTALLRPGSLSPKSLPKFSFVLPEFSPCAPPDYLTCFVSGTLISSRL